MKLTIEQIKVRNEFNRKLTDGEYVQKSNPCLCNGGDDTQILDIDRYGIQLSTKLCNKCGVVRSDPYYDEKTLKAFYDNEYRPLYTNSNTPTTEFFDHEILLGNKILRNIKETLQEIDLKDKKVYEVGCGGGGILMPFKEAGAQVYGCDLGSEYLNIGIEKGMNLVQGDVDSLVQFGQADFIILHHVVEHFLQPKEKLEEISKLLKPDGFIYIAVPGLRAHRSTYGSLLEYLQNAHVFSFTKITLNNLMISIGFNIVNSTEEVWGIYKFGNLTKLENENIDELRSMLLSSAKYGWYYALRKKIFKGIKNIVSKLK